MRTGRHPSRNRTRRNAIAGLTGIVVALILLYVSYNALGGLPFQSRYHLYVKLSDADRLVPTDDVRIANVRVGEVSSVSAVRARDGRIYARIGIAISPSVGHLPTDTRAGAEAVSPLGQTYVDLIRGHSRTTIPEGGTLPLSRAVSTVAVTDLFQIFNGRSARSFQSAIGSLAAGVAGRGAAINDTISSLATLLPPATRLSAALAAPSAGLAHLISGLQSTAQALVAVRRQVGGFVSNGAATFDALAGARPALAATVDGAPSAEAALTAALDAADPALGDLAVVMQKLGASGPLLPRSLGILNSTLQDGAAATRRLPLLTTPLRVSLRTLTGVAEQPSTDRAVRGLHDLLAAAVPIVNVLGPAQEQCNIIALLMQNLSSFLQGAGTGVGPSLAIDGLGDQPAPIEFLQNAKPSPGAHTNPLPIENSQECESNNEPFNPRTQDLTNPAGPQQDGTRITVPPAGVLASAKAAGLLAPNPPQ